MSTIRSKTATVTSAALAAALACACSTDSADIEERSSAATACPGDGICEPAEFVWTYHPVTARNPEAYYSGTMEVGEASFFLNNGDTLTTRAYRQQGGQYSIPGPTIRVAPGSKYVLRFHNTLPYEAPSPDHNVLKDPNISNIHTHGLHISGESPGDDVTRSFEGGYGGDFVWDIPSDHMGGTFWYHAHHHGSTFLQVSGGMFGLLIVDDSNDGVPASVDAMTERQLVVAFLDTGAAGTGGDTLLSGSLAPSWTVNGKIGGTFDIPAGEWQHVRLLLADRNAMEKDISFGAGCDARLMARDGVWRTTVPKPGSVSTISLTGASRADFALNCTANSQLTVNGNAVANIAVGAAGSGTGHPWDTTVNTEWEPVRPAYLRDLTGVSPVNTESIRMGARTINGSKFDPSTPTFALPTTDVQEWSINGAAMHPFHLHVYHVQTFGCGGDFEDGEYYDVVASNCSIRFDLNASTTSAYDGRTIMHCHILEHEDQGAMGWMDVIGGAPPPSYPVDGDLAEPYSEHYSLGGTPAPYCGDGTCDSGEDSCSCAADCGAAPSSELACTDGTDNDCDGVTDCDDSDCGADPACVVTTTCDDDGACEAGEDCNNCSNDCAGVTSGRPSNRYCCGDGTAQSPEGDGSICDGNY